MTVCECGIVAVQILNYLSYYPHPPMETLQSGALFILVTFLTVASTNFIDYIVIILFCTITILITRIWSILLEILDVSLVLIIIFLFLFQLILIRLIRAAAAATAACTALSLLDAKPKLFNYIFS